MEIVRRENTELDSAQMARMVAQAAEDKKARNVVVLDMRGISPVTDYFIICSGFSSTQVKAIADHIEEKMDQIPVKKHHGEGYDNARWVLLDFGDVVAHVFHDHERSFYNLERLWGDAQVVDF